MELKLAVSGSTQVNTNHTRPQVVKYYEYLYTKLNIHQIMRTKKTCLYAVARVDRETL